jgi:hypothetical protein
MVMLREAASVDTAAIVSELDTPSAGLPSPTGWELKEGVAAAKLPGGALG